MSKTRTSALRFLILQVQVDYLDMSYQTCPVVLESPVDVLFIGLRTEQGKDNSIVRSIEAVVSKILHMYPEFVYC